MTPMQLPTPSNDVQFVVVVGAVAAWAIASTAYFLFLKYGGKKNVTDGADKYSAQFEDVRNKLGQDKISIDRVERDIRDLWEKRDVDRAETARAINRIESAQSKAVIEIMSIMGRLRGIIESKFNHRGDHDD